MIKGVVEHRVVSLENGTSNQVDGHLEHLRKVTTVHYKQTPQWAEYRCSDRKPVGIVTLLDEQVVAWSLISRGRRFAGKDEYFIERGPVVVGSCECQIHLNEVLEQLRDKAISLKVSPYCTAADVEAMTGMLSELGFRKENEAPFYMSSVVLDLRKSVDDIWSGFRESLKRQIRKAERSERELRVGMVSSMKGFVEFCEHYNAFAATKRIESVDTRAMDALYRAFLSEERGRIFTVHRLGRLVAAITLFDCGDRVIYGYGYSSQEEDVRRLPLSHMLHWEAIKWAKREKNVRWYDFGGYWSERGDDNPINRFKTGFSKTVVDVGPYMGMTMDDFRAWTLEVIRKGRTALRGT